MNAYSPIADVLLTAGLIVTALALGFDLVVCAYFGRKGRELMQRGGMWGGQ